MLNQTTLKSQATLIGKVFQAKGVKLSRAEQLDLAAQLSGARNWQHASGELAKADCADAPEYSPLDGLQREVAQAYCSGDYSHMLHKSELPVVADGLFRFIVDEVGDAKGERDEAVSMLHAAVDQLEDVIFALENETFKAKATRPDPTQWDVFFLTDRFGHLEPDLEESLRDKYAGTPQLQRVVESFAEELTFAVECNGHFGLLFEVELQTEEIDGDEFKSATELQAQLEQDIEAWRRNYPFLQWCVAGPKNMHEGRLGIWAFSPAACLVSPELAETVAKDMVQSLSSIKAPQLQ